MVAGLDPRPCNGEGAVAGADEQFGGGFGGVHAARPSAQLIGGIELCFGHGGFRLPSFPAMAGQSDSSMSSGIDGG
jgi:hypothetical protein